MSKYPGVLWLSEQPDQRHSGAVELGADRVMIYIADQVVADWLRSDVVFTGAGSTYGISSEGESLIFEPTSASAFAAGIGSGLAGRIAQVVQSRSEPTVAAQPQPMQQPSGHTPPQRIVPKKRRRWPWVVGGLILIGMIANAGEDGSPSTLRSSPSNNRTVTTREDPGDNCRTYATRILPIMADSAEAAENGSNAAFSAAAGEISYDQAADVFRESADTFGDGVARIRTFGDPPTPFAAAVPLLLESLTTLEAGYGLAAIAAEAEDVDLLNEAVAMMEDGNALMSQADGALGSTC